MAYVRTKHLLMMALVICLLSAWAAVPVQAGQAAQTVPTAGPSPTPRPVEDPGGGASDPAPTAVLATSPVQGIQPTATPTQTQTAATQPATQPAASATSVPASNTAPAQTQPAFTETAVQATKVQATKTMLPTLVSAAPASPVSPAGALCYPAGVLALGGLLWVVLKFVRRSLVRAG